MGRHSAPGPDDEQVGEDHHPDESPTQSFGYPRETAEGHDESGYEHGYDDSDFDEHDYDEPVVDEPETARTSQPPIPPRSSGPQHGGDWEGGEWTGSHRAVTPGRRGISVGVIVALITVVVVVGALILWRFFGDALSHRSDAAAARCVDGELAVPVVVDPAIAGPIQTLADSYNTSADPVGDRCVKVGVKPAESDQVINGFTGKWPAELGEQPALWIPASSVSQARLESTAGAQTVSDSRSLVTSPVVLAVNPALKTALAQQNWGTLPGLQNNPNGLDGLNLSGWGGLRLALPLTGDSDASYLAAEAVAAASAPDGGPASAGTGAVNTLMSGQPKLADTKASTALDALIGATDPAAAPVHAVVTTEQQLYQRANSTPNAKNAVAAWLPPGPTAVADFPTVLLSGKWLGQEQVAAASEFARFIRKPEQLAELTKAGFRTEGATPANNDVLDFPPLGPPVSVGDTAARATLASALTAPVGNPAVTIMLDQSMPADEGGKSRLANVVAALNARLQALPSNSAVGLWTFDGVEGRSEVPIGTLSDQVDGKPRSAALTAALDAQIPSGGGAVSFTTLRLLYDQTKSNFRQGQTNSILVITAGPHSDQTLGGDGLQAYIRGAFDPARPVAVNVIDFGSDSDRATWEAVAQATGGTYKNLDSSASPDLTATIAAMTS